MICEIKNKLCSDEVKRVISHSFFDASPEGIQRKVDAYVADSQIQVLGYIQDESILGVAVYTVQRNRIEINNIAVDPSNQKSGIGRNLITSLQDKYRLPIQAETDDDAVDFYRKCGFEVAASQKYGVNRYTCMLKYHKPLDEINDEERAKLFPIILTEYNPAWPQWYEDEKAKLEKFIGAENIARISHYGSTSVPGLLAKPTVDILLEIKEDTDVDKLIASLPTTEYGCLYGSALSMSTPPPHLMIIKGYTASGFAERVYHIHVQYPGDPNELYFRDYLIAHPETAAEYAALKIRLFKDYEYNRDGYTAAKSAFIRTITEKARR